MEDSVVQSDDSSQGNELKDRMDGGQGSSDGSQDSVKTEPAVKEEIEEGEIDQNEEDPELASALGDVAVFDQERLEQKVEKEIEDHERTLREAGLVKERDQLDARIKEATDQLGQCRASLDELCRSEIRLIRKLSTT